MSGEAGPQPPLADYGLISDCRSAALVSRAASIDWCCMPRFDSGSYFGRLLDWEQGGYCSITPVAGADETFHAYLDDTLVLRTTFRHPEGELLIVDFFAIPESDEDDRRLRRRLLRIARAVRGSVELELRIVPRFDYGSVRPGIRSQAGGVFTATGGDDCLLVWCDAELAIGDDYDLTGRVQLSEGEEMRLALESAAPQELDSPEPPSPMSGAEIDRALERTAAWWREWSAESDLDSDETAGVRRSAIVLRGLCYEPTGAIVGAPTTSLSEVPGADATWDYRYSWIRDSTLAARSLAELGHRREADRFRRFIQRSAAGNAQDLQVVYGVGGERRLVEQRLDELSGYRGATPVRVGNSAIAQLQLDSYGQLVNLVWRWHRRGHSPDDDDWRFVLDLVDTAIERWTEPDCGIWETRGRRRHFVHSKVLCWSAADRGLALAKECMRKAPTARWRRARREMREAIEAKGCDPRRGVLVQAFGGKALDAALLLVPTFDFYRWDDPVMVRTADAVRSELGDKGLVRRYRTRGPRREGAFVACSFWLAECLARQGRVEEAREVFDRAVGAANPLGLMSEEVDPESGELLGNYPQAFSHLSHIAAALALAEAERTVSAASGHRRFAAASGG